MGVWMGRIMPEIQWILMEKLKNYPRRKRANFESVKRGDLAETWRLGELGIGKDQ
jgi:hypothetical protein